MIAWLVELYRPWVDRLVLVIDPSFEDATRAAVTPDIQIDLVFQQHPTGMLDAVLAAHDRVAAIGASRVWITWCDQIAIQPATIRTLALLSDAPGAAPCILPTARLENPYVHLQRDENGAIVGVLHRRENDPMPPAGESDAGLFSLSRAAYLIDLPEYARRAEPGIASRERNFLPCIPWFARRGGVQTFPCADPIEAAGVNTPEDLARVSRIRRLSIVIPAFNEERFIGTLLDRIAAVDLAPLDLVREIIVVDDCSADRTAEIASAHPGVLVHRLERNSGKGAAVRAGIARATGDFLLIQDADLEYDPKDCPAMLRPLLAGDADAVYGSRYMNAGRRKGQSFAAYLGGRSLSLIARALTGQYLSDTVTALKLFRRADVAALPLASSGFELDHEITARMLARGARIREVPISYDPRSKEEGKKIGARDWVRAVGTFWRYRRG